MPVQTRVMDRYVVEMDREKRVAEAKALTQRIMQEIAPFFDRQLEIFTMGNDDHFVPREFWCVALKKSGWFSRKSDLMWVAGYYYNRDIEVKICRVTVGKEELVHKIKDICIKILEPFAKKLNKSLTVYVD